VSASSARITRLQKEALLEVTGRDAATFLHNQASCDLKQLQPGHASYGSFCNPQGRVLADFIALALGPEHILLRLRREILDSSLAALGRFAMFSKVTLQAASNDWELLGCRGAGTAEALRPLFSALPGVDLAWTGDADALVLQLDEQSECFEVWLNRSEQPALLEQLEQTLPAASESDWEAANLRRGIARITGVTAAELLPQQLNYDLSGHINFRKGCYPGQEVIARMHYKGKAKRRMLLVQLPAGSAASAGDSLYTVGKEQAAAQIVNAAITDDGKALALISTTQTAAAEGLRLAPDNEQLLQVLELPYPVPFG
jgi:folate-binding protein YgfZ